ncbi:U-box domain-containing protein 4-like [Andrographis paniculata]|uniref:U-box domain-containing protein 4-like n=1 Tax=Andrographis paniculata TaxID=175694 RepID=UPI0021E88FF1|nr:U-box domain-containing protein 4-like [Andrographis paniculata]
MGKFVGGKDTGSGVLERSLKLWSLVIESVRCRGGHQRREQKKVKVKKHSGSERLSELLKQQEWWENGEEQEEVRKKEQVLEGLKKVAKKLQQQISMEEMLEGATEVRKLTKDNPQSRTTLALLGVIPPLVSMLDDQDPTFVIQIAALYALLNLSIANDANKAAIVKAGAIHKMIKLIQSPNEAANHLALSEAAVANFLGLSALDSNKPIIGSSGAIPFLVHILKDLDKTISPQAKQDSMRALCNLSISPPNIHVMLETDVIPYLFANLADMDLGERILSILSNIVSVPEGRKAISTIPDAFPILIDIFNWVDSPGCQEKASYILMVMAHKSYGDRQAMVDAGVVSSLLELTLLGSTLAQKRASRILECLRVEKGKQICGGGSASNITLSAPLYGTDRQKQALEEQEEEQHEDDEMMSQEKKAVKQLVQQSLQNNMNRMVKRANLPHDFVPSDHFKAALAPSSTSKSLPF